MVPLVSFDLGMFQLNVHVAQRSSSVETGPVYHQHGAATKIRIVLMEVTKKAAVSGN